MRMGWCRHYNGILNPVCRAGVPYLAFGPSPVREWPCSGAVGSSCVHQSLPTEEEVAAWRREMSEAMAETLRILSSIPREGLSGTVSCPRCGSTIHWSRSPRNRHLHAKCDTPGCFVVME